MYNFSYYLGFFSIMLICLTVALVTAKMTWHILGAVWTILSLSGSSTNGEDISVELIVFLVLLAVGVILIVIRENLKDKKESQLLQERKECESIITDNKNGSPKKSSFWIYFIFIVPVIFVILCAICFAETIADFFGVVLLAIVPYVLIAIVFYFNFNGVYKIKQHICTHPFISWHIAYLIVFSLVCFCSVIGYSETFSRQYTLEYTLENLNLSAVIAVLSTSGISFVVLIFLYLSDKIWDKKYQKKGCYITKTPINTSQEVQNHQSSKADDHPFRIFFCLYLFYVLAILFSVAFTEYIFIEKIKLFVDLTLLCSVGYVMIWISLLVLTIIIIPVINRSKKAKNIEKELVCRNCGYHNSISSCVCFKCGIDFINYDTSIDRKNMLDICRIPDIHNIDSKYCTKLIDADIYSFFIYDVSKYSGKCLLRYNRQNEEVVYFGKCYEFNCVYKGYLFSANKHSDARKDHRVIARHVVSGKEETYFWFSPGTIWNGDTYCQDSVNQLYIDNDVLVIEVHRTKTFDFPKEYSKYALSKYNANTDYIITVTYIDGKFNVEKTFPNLINDL